MGASLSGTVAWPHSDCYRQRVAGGGHGIRHLINDPRQGDDVGSLLGALRKSVPAHVSEFTERCPPRNWEGEIPTDSSCVLPQEEAEAQNGGRFTTSAPTRELVCGAGRMGVFPPPPITVPLPPSDLPRPPGGGGSLDLLDTVALLLYCARRSCLSKGGSGRLR